VAQLTIFFDRCTGSAVPKLLQNTRAPFLIEYHDDKKHGFAQDRDDDKWIVISHDKRFHTDSVAIEAVRQRNGRVFYLDGGSSVKWDKLRRFAAAYKRIAKIAESEKEPFIYRVTYADKVIRVVKF
jgi:PIN like domain